MKARSLECHRAEVLLEVTDEGVADALAEEDAAADHHPADRAVGGHAQQHADLRHPAGAVDADRDGVDVHQWDVRPHHLFDTVEVRICDMPTNLEHTITIVALIQALMAKLYLMHRRNTQWRVYPRSLLEET